MAATVVPVPFLKPQWFDNNGNILANGSISTYLAGSNTAANTYTDSTGTVLNQNPVALDASGRADIWLVANTSYKLIARDANNNQQWVEDNVTYGSGLISGVVLLAGNQTITGPLAFNAIAGFGRGTLSEYQNGVLDIVIGAQSENTGGAEIVGSKFSNLSFTTAEGTTGGTFSYDQANSKFNLLIAGVVVATIAANSVTFPDASTFSANGQTFLTPSSVVQVNAGGTGQTTAPNALIALLPGLVGNVGNVLTVLSNTAVSWNAAAAGNSSIGTTGYYVLPGGLYIQWGNGSYGGGASFTQNFAVPFPTGCLWADCQQSIGGFNMGISSFSTTTLTFNVNGMTGTSQTIYWIAIGH